LQPTVIQFVCYKKIVIFSVTSLIGWNDSHHSSTIIPVNDISSNEAHASPVITLQLFAVHIEITVKKKPMLIPVTGHEGP
jgi:hypothetical protein